MSDVYIITVRNMCQINVGGVMSDVYIIELLEICAR